jgi:hypothetical protein
MLTVTKINVSFRILANNHRGVCSLVRSCEPLPIQSRSQCLLPCLMTRVQFLGPARSKERADCHQLSSEGHTCSVGWHYTHTFILRVLKRGLPYFLWIFYLVVKPSDWQALLELGVDLDGRSASLVHMWP